MYGFLWYLDQPQNLTVTKGKHIAWKAVSCAGDVLKYRVEIVRINDSDIVYIGKTNDTKVNIADLMMDQPYSVIVTPIVHGTCSGNPAFMNFTLSAVEGNEIQISTSY